MANPSFERKGVVKIADNLLIKLFEETKGDECESIKIDDIYSRSIRSSNSKDETDLKNNVIQHLNELGDITINPKRTEISITPEGISHYKILKRIREEVK